MQLRLCEMWVVWKAQLIGHDLFGKYEPSDDKFRETDEIYTNWSVKKQWRKHYQFCYETYNKDNSYHLLLKIYWTPGTILKA